jgi:5-methylcytosine-specific restriction endonuclease McrA
LKQIQDHCKSRGGLWGDDGMVTRADRGFTRICKKCNALRVKLYYKANPEKKKAVRKRVNKRSYDKNRPARLKQKSEYGKANPEKRKSWAQKRVEAMGAVWELKPGEWPALLRKLGRKCLCCGSTKDITKDHVIPLIEGGRHHISNLQPLCRSCNSRKGRKTIDYRP